MHRENVNNMPESSRETESEAAAVDRRQTVNGNKSSHNIVSLISKIADENISLVRVGVFFVWDMRTKACACDVLNVRSSTLAWVDGSFHKKKWNVPEHTVAWWVSSMLFHSSWRRIRLHCVPANQMYLSCLTEHQHLSGSGWSDSNSKEHQAGKTWRHFPFRYKKDLWWL